MDGDQHGVRMWAVSEGHAIARLESRIMRRGNDFVRRFVACDPRRITGEVVVALSAIDIGEIQADGAGANQCLLWRRYRIWHFAQLQHLGATEAVEHQCAHVSASERQVRCRS